MLLQSWPIINVWHLQTTIVILIFIQDNKWPKYSTDFCWSQKRNVKNIHGDWSVRLHNFNHCQNIFSSSVYCGAFKCPYTVNIVQKNDGSSCTVQVAICPLIKAVTFLKASFERGFIKLMQSGCEAINFTYIRSKKAKTLLLKKKTLMN